MLGLGDVWVAAAFWLCLLSSALCVAYGAMTWNDGGDESITDVDRRWVEHEADLDEEL